MCKIIDLRRASCYHKIKSTRCTFRKFHNYSENKKSNIQNRDDKVQQRGVKRYRKGVEKRGRDRNIVEDRRAVERGSS